MRKIKCQSCGTATAKDNLNIFGVCKECLNSKVETKTCNRCGEDLPLNEFSKRKQNRDGLHGSCKGCVSNYQRNYYKQNKKESVDKPTPPAKRVIKIPSLRDCVSATQVIIALQVVTVALLTLSLLTR